MRLGESERNSRLLCVSTVVGFFFFHFVSIFIFCGCMLLRSFDVDLNEKYEGLPGLSVLHKTHNQPIFVYPFNPKHTAEISIYHKHNAIE